MEVSVILVTYYTGSVLYDVIDSVLKAENLAKLIIVNNGNKPEDEEKLYDIAAKNEIIKYVTGHGNIGFGAACNLGAGFADSKYIFFLNPDCKLESPNVLKLMAEAMGKNEDAYLACPAIYNYNGTPQKTCLRNQMTPFSAFIELSMLYKILPFLKKYRINLGFDAPKNITAVSGAAMFFRRDKFFEIGKFDEKYFLHFEDLDLCFSVTNSGGKIIFVKDAKVKHKLSTSDVSSRFIEDHKLLSLKIFLKKHYGSNYLFLAIFIMIAYIRYYFRIIISHV